MGGSAESIPVRHSFGEVATLLAVSACEMRTSERASWIRGCASAAIILARDETHPMVLPGDESAVAAGRLCRAGA